LIYAGILDRVSYRGYDSITGRAYVPLSNKLLLLLRALLHPAIPRSLLPAVACGNEDARDEVLLLSLLRQVQVVP
jgi:hypothetical protein